ncbi:MAG TPA: DNA translocase FtsK [Isosphaeraceae bacterium]|jgi:S-DNA-T family DNA segregation ATPase FtsK/SpoIIIE|nr:DNA translocase FtsK [Isosphaeraceae bacterium]
MLDRPRLIRHCKVVVLLCAWVFLALSLAGYDPADPPGSAAEPFNNPPANPCGTVGAILAHVLFVSVGWGSYLFLLALAGADLLLFRRRDVPEKGLRILGFSLVVVVTSALVQKFAPALPRSPAVGSGGYLGALAVVFLGGQFGPVGMLLILMTAGIVGLAFCHDVLLLWPAQELIRAVGRPRRKAVAPLAGVPPSLEPPRVLGPASFEVLEPGRARPDVGPARPALNRPIVENGVAGPGQSLAAGRAFGPTSPAAAPGDGSFDLPPLDLLEPPPPFPIQEHEAKIHGRALLLEKTLQEFGYQVRVVQIDTGPVITQFEIELEAGLRVSKIISLADDLAIALAVPSVRIVAPIPGKTTVGIEVPNDRRNIVKLGEVIGGVSKRIDQVKIPLFLGKDVKGTPMAFDLADMPHLLIAGRTGTGKSVCLNAMILSILMTRRPDEVKLILIDPKMVELSQFKRIPHLMHPVVTDMKKAESLLSWACDKMDERYEYLLRAGVRNIQAYNELGAEEIFARLQPGDDEERARIPTHMPYIVIIADEMADLMMTAAKEVESHIVRLAQKSRAVGMHLIVATQKPTVDVITGLIKGNLPARISFQVASRSDSRVVLDEMGADRLLGNGDMLFLIPGTSHIIRAQGTYVSDGEVHRVCEFLHRYPVEFSRELVQLQVGGGPGGKDRGAALRERDELYEPAIEIVIREQRGSCSLLQRALGIGYGRAARLIDFMAEDGIVGEYKSGSAREVLYSWDEWEALKNDGAPGSSAA